jgi:hypothetical protein
MLARRHPLLATNREVARQATALTLYVRQCHAERDLEQIACSVKAIQEGA